MMGFATRSDRVRMNMDVVDLHFIDLVLENNTLA
jgi:hypothetical protein